MQTAKTASTPMHGGEGPIRFDGVIFDLDGVLTQSARLHAAAWKALFDEFFQHWAAVTGQTQAAFDLETDYLVHLDGKPRQTGLRDFLMSRGIDLPLEAPGDATGLGSLSGLNRRKNQLYLELIRNGVPIYASSVKLLKRLREIGTWTAVTSSSRNCTAVLKAAGILDLFDMQVDGEDAQRLGLPGKPAPDLFLHAARTMGLAPARCVVVEDALAGIQAARRGGFGLVIGVDRHGHARELQQAGADWVVSDLSEVGDASALIRTIQRSDALPSALEAIAEIKTRRQSHRLAVFLDYDGTLTPIVDRPELALLSNDMRTVLRELTRTATVAILSGRDLTDVRSKVGVEGIVYGGSHGFEIQGPQQNLVSQQIGMEFLPLLNQAENALRQQIGHLPGLLVERKKFSIAVHVRLVDPTLHRAVETCVDTVLVDHPGLRKTRGKLIYEVQPDIAWNKGRAMDWLLQTLELRPDNTLVLYIGDDSTDEDAFKALHHWDHGVGILVRDASRATAADYALQGPDEVRQFLALLITEEDT